MPAGSISASPSIWAAAHAEHGAALPPACAAMARSSPCARSQARSAALAFGPGRNDPVAGPQAATSAGLRTHCRRTPGTFLSGWNSSRLLMRAVGHHGHRGVHGAGRGVRSSATPPSPRGGRPGATAMGMVATVGRAPCASACNRCSGAGAQTGWRHHEICSSTKPWISARSFSGSSPRCRRGGQRRRPGRCRSPAGSAHGHGAPRHVDDVAGVQVDFCGRTGLRSPPRRSRRGLIERGGNLRPPFAAAALLAKRSELGITWPISTTWLCVSASGLSKSGFMRTSGSARAASLEVLGEPISPQAPSGPDTTRALLLCVLRLERRHLQALVAVVAAQRGWSASFAGAAGGAQHHDADSRAAPFEQCGESLHVFHGGWALQAARQAAASASRGGGSTPRRSTPGNQTSCTRAA